MTFKTCALSVSTLALAMSFQAFAAETVGATTNEPSYTPATVVSVNGTIAAIRQVAAGNPLAGVHVTLKTKTDTLDVYLAPSAFLKFLKADFPVGDHIQVIGSKVKFESADMILARQVDDGADLVTLRESSGASEWQHWGQEVDPSQVR